MIYIKKVRSYTSIWNVEKVIYAISDLQLPFPITLNQMAWFVVSLLFVIMFSNVPPLSFINGAFLKYLGIPVAFTWFMSKKTFDGKKPFGFLKSVILYLIRPKVTYAGKKVETKTSILDTVITVVRSDIYVPDKVYRKQSRIQSR